MLIVLYADIWPNRFIQQALININLATRINSNHNWSKKETIHESPVRIWIPMMKTFVLELQNLLCSQNYIPKTSNPFSSMFTFFHISQNVLVKRLHHATMCCVKMDCVAITFHHIVKWSRSHHNLHTKILMANYSFSSQFSLFIFLLNSFIYSFSSYFLIKLNQNR